MAPDSTRTVTDALTIADRSFASRLLMGSGGYPNQQVLLDSLQSAQPALVTVALRRISLEAYAESLVDLLDGYVLLPNTAGCATVKDAVLTAQLGREALETNWVKLELIGDRETLYPDVEQLLIATDQLVKDGFVVLPYCNDDPGDLPQARRSRRRGGDAAGLADRHRSRHRESLRDRAHRARPARCR